MASPKFHHGTWLAKDRTTILDALDFVRKQRNLSWCVIEM
jgi:hypothetical protein